MKTLVKHLVENHLDEIVEKSIFNCHCLGLHSIMLLDSPEKTIRMYYSTAMSSMYKNLPETFLNKEMTLGFHSHHCNLTLECIKGRFLNWEVSKQKSNENYSIQARAYKYQSKIKDGELQFKELGEVHLNTTAYRWVSVGEAVHMPADQIHTVATELGCDAAWLVYEGKEDAEYDSLCYSNSNPNLVDTTFLYVKPNKEQVLAVLKRVNLIK